MSRSERLLSLLQTLRRHRRPISGHALANELGVSIRTLYRDIATLQGQGAAIEGEAGLGYVLKPGFMLPPLMFGEDEVDAMILGLRFVARRGDGDLATAAVDALSKIVDVLPPDFENVVATSGLLAGPSGSGALDALSAIRRAIRSEHKLKIEYSDRNGSTSARTVWPIAIGFFDRAEVMVAWCESRNDFRHFRLDRIDAVDPLDEKMPKGRRVLLADWRRTQNIDEPL